MKYFAIIVASSMLAPGGLGFGQEPKEAPSGSEAKPAVLDEDAKEKELTQIEREIAFVRIAALTNEIDLANLAYQKSGNEKVRELASKWEAIHSADRDRLERLTRMQASTTPRQEEKTIAREAAPPSRAATGDSNPGIEPRKGGGTQDPSYGNRPDAGSLDEYNRNTVNPKKDNEEDKAQLQKALKEQSAPGVLEKRREVEKPAADDKPPRPIPVETDDWVVIQQKIAAKRLENARRELAAKGGLEFDECYLRMVVVGRQRMIDEDQVFGDYVSPARRTLIAESEKKATEQIVEAKTLLKELTSGKKGFER
jgi:predicted outer membrane protein